MIRNTAFALLICLVWIGFAQAVPESVSVRVADVTTTSFSLVWLTDVPAMPGIEIYADSAMSNPIIDVVTVTAMPDAPSEVAAAARGKGVMKVRVAGLSPHTTYYARGVTADPANPASIGHSALQEVTTAATVAPYRAAPDGTLQGFANDLVSFRIYIRPADSEAAPGLGDLILLETPGSPYPLSAFVGVGIQSPEGIIDLNNLFGTEMVSLLLQGDEKAMFSVYRGGALATLIHYRLFAASSGTVAAKAPVSGFFADINLDGNVDDQDFALFKNQYRTSPDDPTYNPDYKFADDPAGVINARDFAMFAREYGRTGVR